MYNITEYVKFNVPTVLNDHIVNHNAIDESCWIQWLYITIEFPDVCGHISTSNILIKYNSHELVLL